MGYDALGNKRFHSDEARKKTEFQYDKAGLLVQITAPFDHRIQIVKYYYDGAGITREENKLSYWRRSTDTIVKAS